MARKVTYKRRPNNSGTVVKLSGKRRKPYCAKITSEDYDLVTGKKKQVPIGTFETELEALNALSLYHLTVNKQINDKEAKELWQWFRDESLKEFARVYDLLDIEFDSYNGESFYSDKMDVVIEQLTEKGLLVQSQGTNVVDLEE